MPPTPLPHYAAERGLLFRVVLATAIAVALIAVAGTLVGTQLSTLTAKSGIEHRASLVAVMLAARMREVPDTQWAALAERMGTRVGGIVTVVDLRGHPIEDAAASPLRAGDPLVRSEHARGEVEYADESYFVATEALTIADQPRRVLVALPLAASRAALPQLWIPLLAVLLGIGALGVASALVVARDIATDVRAITRRALEMAAGESAALEPLPVRAQDEVGELVAAFNRLQRRFADELDAHKTALARLEDAERRKEALIATLRHELRTPLNSIIGFAELMLSGVDGDLTAAQREDLEVVARSGRHLLQLVDDVLDLSAIASGRFVVETRPVDLVSVAREVVREATGSARRRKVNVRVEDAIASAIVEGDPISLRRAIWNLVQNAIEHAGGEVVVDVGIDGRMAQVAVKDNGPGIKPGDLKRLFKPFERGRKTGPGEARPGAGLGLAITVALLDLHGGNLRAESEVGKGSTFVATLPLRPTALDQAGFA
jgi:signal transduction histidine kinase